VRVRAMAWAVVRQLVVEGQRGAAAWRESLTGAGGKGGVDASCETLDLGRDERSEPASGELRVAQVLGDVDGTVVDKLLEAKAGAGSVVRYGGMTVRCSAPAGQ
jgi:hypothetical protein